MKSLAGDVVDLSKYQGKVVMVVNVASKCGYTKHYKQLQEMHEKYAGKGLAILGVPCNQFGGQEPGSNEEIASFCESKFGVEFDMFAKSDVNGNDQSELYKYLTSLDLKPVGKGPVKWNFEKIILDKSGTPVARFGTRESPDSEAIVNVIETALAK
ncbi:MAG: glutathione peroxidase [Mariniblastus sp.]